MVTYIQKMKQTTLKKETMDNFEQFWNENFDQDGGMDNEQRWLIADLLDQVTITDEELNGIRLMLNQSPSFSDATQLIGYLYGRMPNPVTERGSYTQKDLTKHIKNISGL